MRRPLLVVFKLSALVAVLATGLFLILYVANVIGLEDLKGYLVRTVLTVGILAAIGAVLALLSSGKQDAP